MKEILVLEKYTVTLQKCFLSELNNCMWLHHDNRFFSFQNLRGGFHAMFSLLMLPITQSSFLSTT